jgi:hypothetical protein
VKITTEHYNYLRDAITAIPQENIDAHRRKLLTDERVKDADKRLRWDLLYATVPSAWICDNLYSYLNDTHIDTAIKSIINERG